MTPHPPNNAANHSTQNILTCCACNKALDGEGMRFPKSTELKSRWVDIIKTQCPDYPGKNERLEGVGLHLCIKHFNPTMLITKTERGYDTYALKKGGVPTIFNTLQDGTIETSEVMDVDSTTNGDDDISICYETISNTSDVKVSEDVAQVEPPANSAANSATVSANVFPESEMITSSEPVSKTDLIESLENFVSSLKSKDDKYYQPWRVMYNETSVLFSLFDGDCKYLIQSFTVDVNLIVTVYYHGQLFTNSTLTELLGEEFKVDTWTKFKKLVLFLHTVTNEKQNHTMQLQHACHLIKNCIETGPQFGCTEKEIKKWKFLLNQIQISSGESTDFSVENLQWAVQTYVLNRPGYAKIFDTDVLTLPHPATLELFKRQAAQQASRLQQTAVRVQQPVVRTPLPQAGSSGRRQPEPLLRPKVLPKNLPQRPVVPGLRNGLNAPNQLKLVPPVPSGSRIITQSSFKTSPRQNGFSTGNGSAVEEIEIQE